jgi:outer membrane immunogenic protein
MKRVIVASALVVGCTSAFAADIGVPRAPVAAVIAAPVFDWSGFYVGLHAGGVWSRNRYVGNTAGAAPDWAPGTVFGTEPGGFIGGIQLGYNWQFSPNWVAGVETSLSWTSVNRTFNSTFGAADDVYRHRLPFFGTFTGRLGYAAGPALLYARGGLALASVSFAYNDVVAPSVGNGSASSTRAGWTVGLGVEYAINQNWSVAAEYNYAKFGNWTAGLNATDSVLNSTAVHAITARLNYRFWTGPSAVVARY